jgi:hypothetical protein
MRCLLAADLHYSLPQFDRVSEVAEYFDIVVLAGDHLDLASMVDYRAQSTVVKNCIGKVKEKTRLLVCSGNHDLDTRDENGERISRWILDARSYGGPCDGDSLGCAGTLFTMCPWWDGPAVRRRIEAPLAEHAKKRLLKYPSQARIDGRIGAPKSFGLQISGLRIRNYLTVINAGRRLLGIMAVSADAFEPNPAGLAISE